MRVLRRCSSDCVVVNAYGLNGMASQAVELFQRVPSSNRDGWIYVTTLNACSHGGLVSQAQQIFAEIPDEQKCYRVFTCLVGCRISI
jgi:hypothetical protein